MKSVERFSNRVGNYVKYRPGYPPEVLQLFRDEMSLTPDSIVADIGSGTGISARMFLENGNEVFGVEPNFPMRAAAEEFLSAFSKFHSITGTAEETKLADKSVDIVIAAQAFHWFDPDRARIEFGRILRNNGFVALIWNKRDKTADDFSGDYERLLLKFATDSTTVPYEHATEEIIGAFFREGYQTKSFSNKQLLDFEGLNGRILSSSYMPVETDEAYEPLLEELRILFAKHAEIGKIKLSYKTAVFYSHL